MIFKLLADTAVLLHFLWIVFLVAGAVWGKRYALVKFLHLSGLAFALVIQVLGWYCPITHLEVWLRSRHDPALGYAGSFIAHYLEKLVYIEAPPWVIFILTVLLFSFNAWFYLDRGVFRREA